MGKPRKKRDGTWAEPKALRRFHAALADEMKREEFREVFGREPRDESELDVFIETLTFKHTVPFEGLNTTGAAVAKAIVFV